MCAIRRITIKSPNTWPKIQGRTRMDADSTPSLLYGPTETDPKLTVKPMDVNKTVKIVLNVARIV